MAGTGQAAGLRGWWAHRQEASRIGQRQRAVAFDLYGRIVAQARLERFYADWGVPDTRDGRFEMIGLHAALVMQRLRMEGAPGQELAQALFDLMFADMDHSLREIGVGDLSVGKYIKRMAQTFFARARALDGPLAAGDAAAVAAVLARNVYVTGTTPPEGAVLALARYLIDRCAALRRQPGQRLLEGALDLDPPDALSSTP